MGKRDHEFQTGPRREHKSFVSEVSLSDSISTVADDLRRHRIIWFYLPVEDVPASLIAQRLLALDLTAVEPIKLFICSEGGFDIDMWSIVDMIKWIRSPVYTYAIGICASAATGIFAAGEKRFIFPDATLMLHTGSSDTEGDPDQIQNYYKYYKKTEDQYLALLSEATGKKPATLKKMMKEKTDLYLDADQAVKLGLAHEIVTGKRPSGLLKRRKRKKR